MGTIPAPNIADEAGQIAAAPINALAEFSRVAQLKQQTALAQQQTQAAAQENQIRQQSIEDQKALTAAMHDWDGKDPDALPGLLTKRGGSANAVLGLQKSVTDRKTQLATLDKDQLANMATHHDAALGVLDAAKNVKDEELMQHIGESVQQLQTQGHLTPAEAQTIQQHSQSMPPDQFRPWLDVYEKSLRGEKAQIDKASKEQEQKTNQQKADAGDWKEGGGGTLVNVNPQSPQFGKIVRGAGALDQQELTAYLSNPRLDPDLHKKNQKDPATFAAWKAKQSPMGLVLGNQLGASGPGTALDQAAERYHETGVLPAGFSRSPGTMTKIMQRSAELHPDADIAGNAAVYAANKKALGELQGQFSKVTAFENTAIKNIDRAIETGKKIPDLGVRFANMPIRKISEEVLGTPEMSAFRADLATAQTEAAKVLNSSTGAGVLSDSARHELQDIVSGNLPYPSMVAALNELKNDMGNRHQSYADEIAVLQKSLGGKSSGSATQPTGHKAGDTVVQGGHKFKVTAVDANGKVTAADPL